MYQMRALRSSNWRNSTNTKSFCTLRGAELYVISRTDSGRGSCYPFRRRRKDGILFEGMLCPGAFMKTVPFFGADSVICAPRVIREDSPPDGVILDIRILCVNPRRQRFILTDRKTKNSSTREYRLRAGLAGRRERREWIPDEPLFILRRPLVTFAGEMSAEPTVLFCF